MCIELACGYSSQTLAKAVAYVDISLALSTFVLLGILWEIICGGLSHLARDLFTENLIQHYANNYGCALSEDLKYLLIFIGVFYCLGMVILAMVLLHGANRRDHKTLQRWFLISITLWVVRIGLCILWIMISPEDQRVGPFFLGFFNSFYNGTTMSMVRNLIKQVEVEGLIRYDKRKRLLT
ncbi:unnamed protein product [Allacma fusca]|uniref:Uncharacterized protein n=1 Tax=Allacma fusca TaxID=39272 RepID=A0A8J2PM24_9HEXA|nr:unnamed protein product [Allacma fusca]